MESQIKSPVEIVQELIAIHTTRKEAVDKLTAGQVAGNFAEKLSSSKQQSDEFISELMSELSNFGDGVSAGVDRDNEYQQSWKNVSVNVNETNAVDAEATFQDMENTLKKYYSDIIESQSGLPVSLQEILTKQAAKISA